MPEQYVALPWDQEDWFRQSLAWIQDQIHQLGLTLNGTVEEHQLRPWSALLGVPTNAGRLFFKASAPVLIHEARLTQALARWRPDLLPRVFAADPQRGFLLVADGGPTLRSFLGTDDYLAHWRRVLPLYAEMQIEMAGRPDDLLAAGAIDRRLKTLPGQLAELLSDQEALLIGQPDALSADQFTYLIDFSPRFTAMCATLESYGLPETLHHDDFHGNNICAGDRGYLFFDWGESCVAHPFFTMVVTLRVIAYLLKLTGDAPIFVELRDIYLEPWTKYMGCRDLDDVYDLAHMVGMVNRALTWYLVVSGIPEPHKEEEAGSVPGWLLEFLETQAKYPF
jgi:hypothetical protein